MVNSRHTPLLAIVHWESTTGYFLQRETPESWGKRLVHVVKYQWHRITALWEAEADGLPEVRSSRPAWPTWQNPISTKNTKISRVQWQAPIILGPINTKRLLNFNDALFQLISGSFIRTSPQLQLGRG
ncbi:putative uncharacterized protein C8orf44 [Plecturocebus cupreus]